MGIKNIYEMIKDAEANMEEIVQDIWTQTQLACKDEIDYVEWI